MRGNLAEWLTRCPAKALPHGRAGSNPAVVENKYKKQIKIEIFLVVI